MENLVQSRHTRMIYSELMVVLTLCGQQHSFKTAYTEVKWPDDPKFDNASLHCRLSVFCFLLVL